MFQYGKLCAAKAAKVYTVEVVNKVKVKYNPASLGGKKVFPIGSHFMTKFTQCGYSGVARWYKEVRMVILHAKDCYVPR